MPLLNREPIRTRLLVSMLAIAATACGNGGGATSPAAEPSTMGQSTITELVKTDAVAGSGAEATTGQQVTVHYTGWLYQESAADKKGSKFDSSRDRNEPFSFRLGASEVIRGWDEGVAGMRIGGQRTLTIPPAMGYGARGAGGVIPPDATLVFDVELLGVK
jgi:FKBP-type peptidyl-prolyl cis-trans isomerase